LPRTRLAVERFTLANGLRVVASPDPAAPLVGTSVFYDVGFRSEPEGRTGFAHLFEHLMFQGSAQLEKGEADRLIEGNGGQSNGSTSADFTNYISQLPANALELGLFVEAERMRGPRLSEETLRNQIDVVKEEIRLNVLNQPYGGFPWIDLPPVMFRTFHNAHNGYGSFVDLDAATVADAADFFEHYYAPGNAVLSVAGGLSTADLHALVERHFGEIPARPVPARPDFDEPVPDAERRGAKHDALAPLPALAVGWRVPDPVAELDQYLACVVLADVLAGGEASRLYRRLVRDERIAVQVAAFLGEFGDPLDVRHPTMLQVLAWHPGADTKTVLAALDEEMAKVAARIVPEELERVRTAWVSSHLRRLDPVLGRSLALGVLEQQRGTAELANELPARVMALGVEDVSAAAARWAEPGRRAVLEVIPGQAA